MTDQVRLVGGSAKGPLVVLDEPVSFWGGFDPDTGLVIEPRHAQLGVRLTDCVVAMPVGKGSSSSSSVLAEALRLGTAPAGFVLGGPDAILVMGSLVANRLYGTICPIWVGKAEGEPRSVWQFDDDGFRRVEDE